MEFRLYSPADADGLDALLRTRNHGSIRRPRITQDRLVVAGPIGEPRGLLVWRPVALIHELIVPPSLKMKKVTDGLVSYARTTAIDRICFVKEAVFLIDPSNTPMLDYVRDCGAVPDPGQLMFTNIKEEHDNGQHSNGPVWKQTL